MRPERWSLLGYEDEKNRSIAVSVGIQVTAEMAKGADDPFEAFDKNVIQVVETVVALQAQYAITAAFPGSTVLPEAARSNGPVGGHAFDPVQWTSAPFNSNQAVTPISAAPSYVPPAAPAAQPAPIPGASDGDPVVAQQWIQFFTDPSAWHDNRFSKKSPEGPDFRHKTLKDAGGKYNLGLWITSKKNPGWVTQALQERGLA